MHTKRPIASRTGLAALMLCAALVAPPAHAYASEEGVGTGLITTEAVPQDASDVIRPEDAIEGTGSYDGAGGGSTPTGVDVRVGIGQESDNAAADVALFEPLEDGLRFGQATDTDVAIDAVDIDEPASPDEATLGVEQPDTLGAAAGGVDMYRVYNPNSGEHFYTSNRDECKYLMSVGWIFEGIGWVCPSWSNTPVYRLYSGTDHHYTVSSDEVNYLLSVGWRSEGIGFYSDDAHVVALYRQYNPNVDPSASRNNSGSHNFTTSREENDRLVSTGWLAEDVGFYASEGGRMTTEFSYFYIDAGHGWGSSYPGQYDPGASGSGYREAEQTAELALMVANYARDLYGLNVYTNAYAGPNDGVDYRLRQQDARSRGCTALVSIHFNSDSGYATGTESYIHSVNPAARSAELQNIIHGKIVQALGLRDRGWKAEQFAVVSGRATNLPAVLFEICFIDNANDMGVYKSREDAVARAIAAGLYESALRGF